jgi:dephospho-CoA kinase
MLLVALTGNIASGKSEVARMFAELGATVIDADVLAREVVEPGKAAYRAIVDHFGKDILQLDGTIDRAQLRAIVFADASQREALNRIVHPEIRRRRDELVAEARTRGDDVVIAVIPLLFEAAMQNEFDRVILVDAPEELRLKRLRWRSGMSAEEGRRIMEAKIDPRIKRPGAHIIIENDSNMNDLRTRVEQAWRELTKNEI